MWLPGRGYRAKSVFVDPCVCRSAMQVKICATLSDKKITRNYSIECWIMKCCYGFLGFPQEIMERKAKNSKPYWICIVKSTSIFLLVSQRSFLETLKNMCRQNRYLSVFNTEMLAASVCVDAD